MAVLMAAFALVAATGAGAAAPPLDLTLSGSGTSHVSYEYDGWRGKVDVTLTGRVTPGGPLSGTVVSDYVFMASDPTAPNSYVITVRGGTITGYISELHPNIDPTTQSGNAFGTVQVLGGTGRFGGVTGGTLAFSYDQAWVQPAPGFPSGNTVLSNYAITGTLTR